MISFRMTNFAFNFSFLSLTFDFFDISLTFYLSFASPIRSTTLEFSHWGKTFRPIWVKRIIAISANTCGLCFLFFFSNRFPDNSP